MNLKIMDEPNPQLFDSSLGLFQFFPPTYHILLKIFDILIKLRERFND